MFGLRLNLGAKFLLYTVLGASAITGLVWIVLNPAILEQFAIFIPEGSLLHLKHLASMTHGIVSFIALVAFGAMLEGHVRSAWRTGRNRPSGVMVVGAGVLLLVTSMILLYSGSDEWRGASSLVHQILGCLGVVVFLVHGKRA